MAAVPKVYMPLAFNKATGDEEQIAAQEVHSDRKAKARYPDKPYPCDLAKGGGGGAYKKALTPGSTPSGS